MAQHVYVEDLHKFVGQEVTLKGWLYHMSGKGKLHFLHVRDGSGIVQAVVSKAEVSEATFADVGKLKQETSIIVTGTVREDKRSALGVELGVKELQIVALPTADFPISPKEHGTAFLMDHRHLWLRSKRQHAILRVRHDDHQGDPRLLRHARLHARRRADLHAQRLRGHEQPLRGRLLRRARPTSRSRASSTAKPARWRSARIYASARPSAPRSRKTRRHLTEFWMVEPEVAFMDLDGDMDLAEDFLVDVVRARARQSPRRAGSPRARHLASSRTMQKPFPRISYDEAIEILHKKGKDAKFGDDFGGDEETVISEEFDRPVMVHRYPADIKAFYLKRDPQDPRVALGVDVLAPEGYGEIIGGGQREDDLEGARAAHRGAQAAARSLRVVPRPAPLRLGAARRLRPRHRAHGAVDLRPAPRARDHPVPAFDGQNRALTTDRVTQK